MADLTRMAIRHKDNFDVCFEISDHCEIFPGNHKHKFKGFWFNITDISGQMLFPMVPETINILDKDLNNWQIYKSVNEAHKDSIEKRKARTNVL